MLRRWLEKNRTAPDWSPVEPGPSGRVWSSLGVVLITMTVVLLAGGWLFAIVRDTVRWENLRSRGRTASAMILGSDTVDDGDGGSNFYVYVSVDQCSCMFKLGVTTLDSHPDGSTIPIRYDPRDRTNAVSLVDRPGSNLAVSIIFFLITAVVVATIACSSWRRRARCRALLATPPARRQVTFRSWQRRLGDTKQYYLELYDAQVANWSEPLCCVPVSRSSIRRLRPNDSLNFYGDPSNASIGALSRERTILLPTSDIQSGAWEHDLRRQ
jgi:hypothetical protein